MSSIKTNIRKLRVLVAKLRLLVSGVIILVLIATALCPSVFSARNPDAQSWDHRLLPPGSQAPDGGSFLLGTDQLGRDILARLVAGVRVSLLIGTLVVISATIVGVLIGIVGGFCGGFVSEFAGRLTEIQLSLPYILLALAIIGVLGPSIPRLVLVMSLATWPTFSRVVSAQARTLRKAEYVEAAFALGQPTVKIILKHIIPNILPTILVLSTFTMATAMVAEAGLSFLGLGVPPMIPSWGAMLADGRDVLAVAWWLATFPGLAIFGAATAFNMLGDYLRDVLDPRLRA